MFTIQINDENTPMDVVTERKEMSDCAVEISNPKQRRSRFRLATKQDLEEMEERLMSVISDFIAADNTALDRVDAALIGLTLDVANLNALVAAGGISAADAAALGASLARSQGQALKLEALDILTPPSVTPTPLPVITSPVTMAATAGQAFTYLIVASAGPTSFDAAPLPAGLVVDTKTGLITGTAPAVGSYSVVLTATNTTGAATATLVLTVNA